MLRALRVTDLALQVSGSAGMFNGSPLQRYFRAARTAMGLVLPAPASPATQASNGAARAVVPA